MSSIVLGNFIRNFLSFFKKKGAAALKKYLICSTFIINFSAYIAHARANRTIIMRAITIPMAEVITPATAAPCPSRCCTRLTIPVIRPITPNIKVSQGTQKNTNDKIPVTKDIAARLLLPLCYFLRNSGSVALRTLWNKTVLRKEWKNGCRAY